MPVKGTVLVRAPSTRLAEGIVTHISRTPADVGLARTQHAAYADALAARGWMTRPVPAAEFADLRAPTRNGAGLVAASGRQICSSMRIAR